MEDAAKEQAVPLYNPRNIDYLGQLARESALFGHAIDGAASDARVPTCPDWNADDLLWHLAEVQWFWGTIVRAGVDREAAAAMALPRPGGRPALMDFYLNASADLGKALAASDPKTPAWTWSDDHTVGFIIRRQAHEALIHRVDAELTAGQRPSAMDAALCADGVDEALRIMFGGDLPPWGAFAADDGGTVRIHATDTGDSWLVRLGRFSGTDPDDNKSYDQPGIEVAGTDPTDPADPADPAGTDHAGAVAATLRGQAADLDCWLWQRPSNAPLERTGDARALADLDALIARGID